MDEISPTPKQVYEPRIWEARIWNQNTGFAGAGVLFKAPYGVAMNASQLLTRAAARGQISRFMLAPASKTAFKKRVDRPSLQRYETAFEGLAKRFDINWNA